MSVILGIIGIVVAVVVLFKLAVVAAPVFVGMQTFIWTMDTGAGIDRLQSPCLACQLMSFEAAGRTTEGARNVGLDLRR
jgi:hypothetical protein